MLSTTHLPNTATKPTGIDKAPRALSILVVEESEPLRRMLNAILIMLGHRTTLAGNAAEALAAIEQERIEVVFCDLTLYDSATCSRDFAHALKSRYPHLLTILINNQPFMAAEEDSADFVLTKPFRLHQIISLLEFSRLKLAGVK